MMNDSNRISLIKVRVTQEFVVVVVLKSFWIILPECPSLADANLIHSEYVDPTGLGTNSSFE